MKFLMLLLFVGCATTKNAEKVPEFRCCAEKCQDWRERDIIEMCQAKCVEDWKKEVRDGG